LLTASYPICHKWYQLKCSQTLLTAPCPTCESVASPVRGPDRSDSHGIAPHDVSVTLTTG
jgi:hypothetical protein